MGNILDTQVKDLINLAQEKWKYETVPLNELLIQKIGNLEKKSFVLRTTNVEDAVNENHAIVNYY